MPTIITSDLPRPKDDEEFQEMIRDLFAAHWDDDNVQNYGRSGQRQNGVDVYLLGHPNKSSITYAIQCKVRKKKLTRKEIEDEVNSAIGFKQKIDKYIIVTSLERDVLVQDWVDEISQRELQNGGFEVNIKFWEDIISLFAENEKIAEKYYPQFYREKIRTRVDKAKESSDITEESPLLLGTLFDLSKKNVLETVNRIEKPIQLEDLYRHLVFKVSAFCKSDSADDILDKFHFFSLGYGLGATRQKTISIFNRLGISTPKDNLELISSDPIRDLFGEIAMKNTLPNTPSLSVLNRNWISYENSLKRQFLDVGGGDSNLYKGLVEIEKRFKKELQRPFYKYPLLIIVSNSYYENSSAMDILRISNDIKNLGVQIAFFLISHENLTDEYVMYEEPQENWNEDVQQMFKVASFFEKDSLFYREILELAKENSWEVPANPKLFFQVNQSEMIKELINLIFEPLQSSK